MRPVFLAVVAVLVAAGAGADEPPTFRIDALPTSLAGEWLFRTGHDPAWSSPFRERHAWQPIQVPGCWQKGAPGSRGHAWYVARLFVPSSLADTELGLDLGVVADADEVFLNGRLIGTRGAFPPRPARLVPTPRLYRLPRISLRYGELNELVVHAYSTAGCSGLLGPPPRVAGYRQLLHAHIQRDLLLSSVAAMLLTLAVLHLALFAAQREDTANLLLGIFLVLASVFYLTQTQWGPAQLLGESGAYRVHIAALLGGVTALIGLVYRHLQLPLPVPLVSVQAALVLGIGFAAVWRSAADLAVLVYLAQATLVLLGPYLVFKIWEQVRRRRPLARSVLAVTLLLAATVAVDIATHIGLLARRQGLISDNLSSLAVIPFAMVFTLAFFQRWSHRRWGESLDAGGGLLSPEKFLRRLEVEMERARRNGGTFSIALLRLSTLGEPARLEVLFEAAGAALRRTLRQIDALAVLRVDTFAVLLADADERAAVFTVERLRLAALSSFPDTAFRAGIAAGVAQFRNGRYHLAREFLAEAEAALYAATVEGTNTTATTP
ncbi:MAG: diguanylate cyclase [Acidobacteriota bacterium]|jgi:GGDEF domain-containing protein